MNDQKVRKNIQKAEKKRKIVADAHNLATGRMPMIHLDCALGLKYHLVPKLELGNEIRKSKDFVYNLNEATRHALEQTITERL